MKQHVSAQGAKSGRVFERGFLQTTFHLQAAETSMDDRLLIFKILHMQKQKEPTRSLTDIYYTGNLILEQKIELCNRKS